MPFSNVPVKNPGRYLEQFVKIVQPRGGECIQKSSPAVQCFAGNSREQKGDGIKGTPQHDGTMSIRCKGGSQDGSSWH